MLRAPPAELCSAMDTAPSDLDDTPRPPPAGWLEALERSEADLAAGRTVPWAEIRARLLATLAEPPTA